LKTAILTFEVAWVYRFQITSIQITPGSLKPVSATSRELRLL